jgi:uncharacterized membrane protein (DUF4010 family)
MNEKMIIDFVLILFFSLLIGMEQKRRFPDSDNNNFGTDRTFTFIGLLGFILYMQGSVYLFAAGLLSLVALLSIFYVFKLRKKEATGITSEILALLVYAMPSLVITQPRWLTLVVYVLLLLLAEMKGYFEAFSKQINKDEFYTLSKFIIMVGVILPALPQSEINKLYLPVSPYKIWLAVVVISSISYISYILKTYVFTRAGLLLTGILGGLYSSTATTFIIAKKSREQIVSKNQYAGAILAASAMMYLRLFILVMIFNQSLATALWPYFLVLCLVTLATSYLIYNRKSNPQSQNKHLIDTRINPLEFRIAILFAILYLFFSAFSQFMLQRYGSNGLSFLSYLVGFTDIDPFLMNLFQGSHNLAISTIALATLQATFSNNVLKLIYGLILADKNVRKLLLYGFGAIIVAGLTAIIVFQLVWAIP